VTDGELYKLRTFFILRGCLGSGHFYGEATAIDPLTAKCMSFLTDLANMRDKKLEIKPTVLAMLLDFADMFPESVVHEYILPVWPKNG
jgi:hypothetical protein